MSNAKHITAVGLVLMLAVASGYLLWRPGETPPIIGVVRTTEVRVAPEVGGHLAAIKVKKGDAVRSGDVVAELSALELSAAVAQARAGFAAAKADRDHVYAGVREEEVASLAAGIAKAKARLEYAGLQHARAASLVRSNTASVQSLDQAVNDLAAAHAGVAEAVANHAAAYAGPTAEQRAIADAQVHAAAAALAVLERRLDKTILRAPADGMVTVVVAEVGEAIRAGQAVLAIEETGKRWLSFNVREDFLHGLAVGATVDVRSQGTAATTPAMVTEIAPLGVFATWQAERATGDHDRNTLRLRLDPAGDATVFEPGMTVWVSRGVTVRRAEVHPRDKADLRTKVRASQVVRAGGTSTRTHWAGIDACRERSRLSFVRQRVAYSNDSASPHTSRAMDRSIPNRQIALTTMLSAFANHGSP